MLTVDSEVLSNLASQSPAVFKRVYLYRRIFSGGVYSFDSAIDISDYLTSITPIKFKLDTETYGEFNISNTTLTLKNDRNQFKQGNTDGFFPSETAGLMAGSKVVIQAGVFLADGTESPVSVFTGYAKDKPIFNPESKTVDITLSGQMSIFDDFNAEDLGTVVTNELLGSDSGTEFITANVATGIITQALRGQTSSGPSGATELKEGTDFNTDDINSHDVGAKITLDTALASGQSLWISYIYWPTDKTIEWIVAQICSLCGVTSTAISPAQFENYAKITFLQDDTVFYSSNWHWDEVFGTVKIPDVPGTCFNVMPGYEYGSFSFDGMTLKINRKLSFWDFYPELIIWRFYTNGYYITPTIDGGETFDHWGLFSANYSQPTGTTSTFSWRESDDGVAWGSWTDMLSGVTIPATKRYLQMRWSATMTPPNQGTYDAAPFLFSWSINYYTSSITIPVVDMTELTCRNALKSLAEMCAYEIGFNLSDTFVFRPRSSSAPVATLDGSNIAEIVNIDDGRDKIYNSIAVTFGNYETTADATTQSETAPTSEAKYGPKELSISSGNFLPASAVNLAESISITVWNYTRLARKRTSLKTKFALDLELGDAVTINNPEPGVLKQWHWGDTDVVYGDSSIIYWTEDMAAYLLSLYNIIMRIEGVEFDLMNWKTTFDLAEVLS